MKYLITMILIFTGTIGFSFNLVREGKEWRYAFGGYCPDFKIHTYNCFFLKGDTLINNNEYNVLYMDYDCNGKDFKIFGFLREYEKKTFFLENHGSNENLLYDFGVEIGDSLTVGVFGELKKLYLDSINFNEENRKTLFLSSRVGQYIWVEGIGSLESDLLMREMIGGFNIFTCCKQNGEIIYLNPAYNSCDITTSVKESISAPALIKIVHIGNGLLQLNTESDINGTLSIFDTNGRMIFDNMPVNSSTQVQTHHTGLHIYRFTNNKGQIQTGKVLVR